MEVNDFDRSLRCVDGRISAAYSFGRDDQYRHVVRLRDRLRRGAGHAKDKSWRKSPVPRTIRSIGADSWDSHLPAVDVLIAGGKLVAPDCLAGNRFSDLLLLRAQTQRHVASTTPRP